MKMKISGKMLTYATIISGVVGMATGAYVLSDDKNKDEIASIQYEQSAEEYRAAERERFTRDVFKVLSAGEDTHDLAQIIEKKFKSKVYTGNNKEHLGKLLYHLDMIQEVYPEIVKGNMYVVCTEDENEKKEEREKLSGRYFQSNDAVCMREPKANTLVHELTHKKYKEMLEQDFERFKADLNNISSEFGALSIFSNSKKTVWKHEKRGYDIFPTPYSNISHSEYVAEVVENIMMCYWYGKGALVDSNVLDQMNHNKFSQVISLLEKNNYIPDRVGKFMKTYFDDREFRLLCLNYVWPYSSLGAYSEENVYFLPEIYKDMKQFSNKDLVKLQTLESQKKDFPFIMQYDKKIPVIEVKADNKGYGKTYEYTNWDSYKKKMVRYKVEHLAPFLSFDRLRQNTLPNNIKLNIEGLGKAHAGLESLYNLVVMSQKEIIESKIVVTPDQMDALLKYLPQETESYLLKLGEKYYQMLPQLMKTYGARGIQEDALLQQHIELYNQILVYYTQAKALSFPEFSLKKFLSYDTPQKFFTLNKQEYDFITSKIGEECLKKYPGIFQE